MGFVFYILFLPFCPVAENPSLKEQYRFFLKDKQTKQAFEKKQKQSLHSFLEKRGIRKTLAFDQKQAKIEYEKTQKQWKDLRKKAFLLYKKQYSLYQNQKKSILERRLKILKTKRKALEFFKTKDPDFDF